jgi:hypothetical protein
MRTENNVAIFLNHQCQKSVADDSQFCSYCGGRSISKVKSFSDPLEKEKEITIENFHEVLQNSTPKIEKAFEMPKAPGTFKSKLVVRLQFILRKLFRR